MWLALMLSGGEPERCLLVAPVEAELLARIRGQTADLPGWRIEVGEAAAETGGAPLLERARALGERFGARVVAWIEPSMSGVQLVIAEARRGELVARRIGGGRSARAEATALILRSALRALGESAEPELGWIAPPLSGRREAVPVRPAGETEPPRAVVGSAKAEAEAKPARGDLGIEAALGWRSSWSGVGGPSQSLEARLGLGPSWTVGIEAALAPPVSSADALSTVELSRSRLALAFSGELARSNSGEARLYGSAGAGVLALHRVTTAVRAGAEATPPATAILFSAGAEARARWTPAWAFGLLGLELAAGFDALPSPLVLRYQDAASGALRQRDLLWAVQPRLGLGLVVGSP
jgi:hypothetical protein